MKKQMDECQKYILDCQKKLPDLCRVKDLVDVGIYKTAQQAYYARSKRIGPPFMIKPHCEIVYPKKGVIDYLKKCYITTQSMTEQYASYS